MKNIKNNDLEIYELLKKEQLRQNYTINLIASENFSSSAIMEAQGSILTNKYAEGYPYKRYYAGCCFVDQIETIAINRAKLLFSAEHANVQPHSGSSANLAIYMSFLQPQDTILAMALDQGGHLTHGSKVNFSGKLYNIISYGVEKKTGLIDYNQIYELAIQYKPKLIIAGASAYPRIIKFKYMKEIANKINAKLMVDMSHISGLIAANMHPSPVPFADYISSTTHKTLRGPRGALILCKEKYAKKIDRTVFPGIQGGPLEHIIAAKAIAFKEASSNNFQTYQYNVVNNAKILANELMNKNFKLISNGTDTHLILIDLQNKNISGKDTETLLNNINIIVNKNKIPFDKTNANITSGIRIGTAGITTRNMNKSAILTIASCIDNAITHKNDIKKLANIKQQIKELTDNFPI